MWTSLPKVTPLILIMILLLAIQSCSALAFDRPTQVSPATPSLGVETPTCIENMIPPKIADIQPSPATPGSEITITGTGGYLEDSCGGINESARSFELYLDDEPVGHLSCYVNHCETKILLADTIPSGRHCLAIQTGVCEFEFQVVSE